LQERRRNLRVEEQPYWIAIGDIHDDVSQIGGMPGISKARGLLISGDITNRGSRARAEALLAKIASFNANILAQIGNMDTPAVEDLLEERNFNVHARTRNLGFGVGLAAVGYSTPTPFGTPSEVSDRQLETWLDQTLKGAQDFQHVILMAHNPPFGTHTDRVSSGQSVGSPAVRAFIEKHQPDVCVTGHIHESKGVDRIGKTKIINPGLFVFGGYVLISLRQGGLKAELRQI
jgi:hypothetical protein